MNEGHGKTIATLTLEFSEALDAWSKTWAVMIGMKTIFTSYPDYISEYIREIFVAALIFDVHLTKHNFEWCFAHDLMSEVPKHLIDIARETADKMMVLA